MAQTAHFAGSPTVWMGNGYGGSWGIAVDTHGNLYVANINAPNGPAVGEALAVNGSVPAFPTVVPLASFYSSFGLAVDGQGNVYVADADLGAIREILAVNGTIPLSPTIRTLCQNCTGQVIESFGVAVDGSGNVYFSDYNNNAVNEILAVNGSIPSSPTIRSLGTGYRAPMGLSLDSSGNLYVADENNGVVKELVAVNGSIPDSPTINVLGSGFTCPLGVAVDGNGNVYVADYCANSAKEMVAVNGTIPQSPTIKSLANGLSEITGIAVDGNGNVYLSGIGDSVYRSSPWGGFFGSTSVGQTGPVETLLATFDTAGTLGSTAVLTQGATGLDFADAGTGSCAANAAYSAGQTCTINVTFTPKYSGTRHGATVLKDANGNVFATADLQGVGVAPQVGFSPGTQASLGSGFYQPWGVAVDANGNVFVAETQQSKVQEILAVNGKIPVSPTIKTLGGGFLAPSAVAVDGVGNLFITDFAQNAVYELFASSGYTTMISLGGGFANPTGVAVDDSGNVFVADYDNNAVEKIPPSCTSSSCVQPLASGFAHPEGVAVDTKGNVFVADSNNFAVKEILADSDYTSVKTLITGIHSPTGVALDGNGNLFVTNEEASTVFELSALSLYGTVTPIGGSFTNPIGVAVDGAGNLYIADTGDSKILMEDVFDPPSLTFASTPVGSTSADSPQTIAVQNFGNADLVLPIPASGSNPSIAAGFTIDSSVASACQIVTSTTLGPITIPAGTSCSLAISFVPAVAGAITGSLVLTDNNLNAAAPGYVTQSIPLNGSTSPVTPTVAWSAPDAIIYGTALSAAQLNATASVPGTFSYSPAAGTILNAGIRQLMVTFTPTDTTAYAMATATVSLTVNKAIPILSWPVPAPITYGTALSASQLDASANVLGTFVYSPGAGTVLQVGTSSLNVVFTPNDTIDYTTVDDSVTQLVNPVPGFTLTTTTPAISLELGTSTSAAILINATGGFSGTVRLAVSKLPKGVTATISPNPATAYSTISLSASSGATKGTSTVTITGTSGSLVQTTTITLILYHK